MFGIEAPEFLVLLVVAALVLGPERLPHYAGQLARFVRTGRAMLANWSSQAKQELGPEFDSVDWQKLDPRQYDPRRIVRDALKEDLDVDDPLGLKATESEPAKRTWQRPQSRPGQQLKNLGDKPAPFDENAT